MKQKEKNLYEGIFIINPNLSEEAREKALERIKLELTKRDGEIQKIHPWGHRKLASEVKGFRDAYYYVIYFTMLPDLIKEIWKEYRLNEDLLRFMTLRAEEVREDLEFKNLFEK